ncbi:hypothetical protein SKAU_G00011800 [Synaphobranchus kaupii]|uniref:Uncharacterized protein n=1 Tax=Synaphobranchus kaupii TaxID=118154 RepID=A0A9Q1GC01_SYNKA|nr:hypothetical protein SKAU_G00011800 [Synaphobranchus kaupii]
MAHNIKSTRLIDNQEGDLKAVSCWPLGRRALWKTYPSFREGHGRTETGQAKITSDLSLLFQYAWSCRLGPRS